MSGGRYDYAYSRVEDMARRMPLTSCCKDHVDPVLRAAFKQHLRKVAAAMYAIEWNDSCDGDETEREKIRACLGDEAVRALTVVTDHLRGAVEQALAGLSSEDRALVREVLGVVVRADRADRDQ